MLLLAGGHMQIDSLALDLLHLLRVLVAGIGTGCLRPRSHIPLRLLQHRRQLMVVSGLLNHVHGHDDLRLPIHGDLRV